MKHAIGRASAALESKGQKVGSLRFANVDVRQLAGISAMDVYGLQEFSRAAQTIDISVVALRRVSAPGPNFLPLTP